MKTINSEMAGLVLQVLVKEGDQVSPGQIVAKIESMKMEIDINSDDTGMVSEVKVGKGDFINEGDTLIVLS